MKWIDTTKESVFCYILWSQISQKRACNLFTKHWKTKKKTFISFSKTVFLTLEIALITRSNAQFQLFKKVFTEQFPISRNLVTKLSIFLVRKQTINLWLLMMVRRENGQKTNPKNWFVLNLNGSKLFVKQNSSLLQPPSRLHLTKISVCYLNRNNLHFSKFKHLAVVENNKFLVWNFKYCS